MTYNHISSSMTPARLGDLLARNSMTRDDLAAMADIPARAIDAIDAGDYDPPLSIAYKLAAALNVPVEQLYSDSEMKE